MTCNIDLITSKLDAQGTKAWKEFLGEVAVKYHWDSILSPPSEREREDFVKKMVTLFYTEYQRLIKRDIKNRVVENKIRDIVRSRIDKD